MTITRQSLREFSAWSALPILLIAAGCAKDMSLDDYRRDKMGQDLNRMQSVDGNYVGSANLNQDRSTGQMSIRLKATTTNQTSSDGLSSEQRVSLWGEVHYYDPTLAGEAVLSFSNGYYNDSDKTFRATIPLTVGAALAPQAGDRLEVYGSIKNGVIEGQMDVNGVAQNGASFSLTRQDAGSDSQSLVTAPANPSLPESNTIIYTGTTESDDSTFNNYKVNFKLTKPDLTNEGMFSSRLRSVRLVDVSTNYAGAIYANGSAIWDLRAHNLRAKLPISGGQNVNLDLDCVENGPGASKGWKCEYTGVNGHLFDVVLKPTQSTQGKTKFE